MNTAQVKINKLFYFLPTDSQTQTDKIDILPLLEISMQISTNQQQTAHQREGKFYCIIKFPKIALFFWGKIIRKQNKNINNTSACTKRHTLICVSIPNKVVWKYLLLMIRFYVGQFMARFGPPFIHQIFWNVFFLLVNAL